ncbi:hypothetical protein [Streptomyces netropsis]|uniref:Uncharacterized protein n=1 Tax=Streptomyces netropsis TaxID=55404 RepID=A0A7W7LGE1_STRNE|nr:hypothetical protein [Streptomyces netropsis]MBB4889755.1 hypothetical protein [Streptomyces netropsis]GGR40894.1 hypothetical protein GCM10010219_52580 [Streptomyces netropsis]
MKTYVGGQRAASADEFIELALGTPLELWLGEPDESAEERAARLDAARDILADDPALVDSVTQLAVEVLGAHAPALLNVTVLDRPRTGRGRASGRAVAA